MGPPRWLARAACGRGVVTCHGSGPGFESCPRRLEGFLWASIVYCQCPGAGRLRLHPVARRAHARSKDARALSWQQTVHVTERVAGARWMRAVSAEQRAGPARDGSGRDDPGYRRSPSMSLFSPMNTPPSDELLEVRIIEKGACSHSSAQEVWTKLIPFLEKVSSTRHLGLQARVLKLHQHMGLGLKKAAPHTGAILANYYNVTSSFSS
ncbi:uncharacterized protein LOC127054058 isoform X2 [Gopherus flavomarginatus]|uniref:uncharacterized protein LOC127054058 isoform X2 n=1 Tax=Gopherus flavomarginatus TaxID=286002 RepID=UPI0021CC2490|nr:uncharacterized protein LOC127054058 isoform X2 [Gopherus flavomarginatus]